MSCHKCKSSPCACADHGLTTPCTYDDCGPVAEPCEEITCAECVSYCGPTFRVTDPLDPTDVLFEVITGDRLDKILQTIALYMIDPACADPDQQHAVWYVNVNNITNNSVTVSWSGVSAQSLGLMVYWSVTTGVWVAGNLTGPLPAADGSFTITGLNPNTVYQFKVESGDQLDPITGGLIGQLCDSVEVQVTTLL
jgi:hypothetical protein